MGKPADNKNIFMMAFDGHVVGRLKSVEGGFAKLRPEGPATGARQRRTKLPEMIEVDPFVIETAAEIEILKWMQSTLRGDATRRSVSIYRALFDGSSVFEIDGYDCIIQEFTMPRLESGSSAKMYLRLVVAPEQTSTKPIKDTREIWPPEAQKWLTTKGYALAIDGLPNLGASVTAIEAFTITQGLKRYATGSDRFARIAPGKVMLPNLTLSVTGNAPKAFRDWLEKGVNDPGTGNEKTGSLSYLTASGDIAFRLTLYDLVPVSVSAPAKSKTGPVKVQIAVGRMEITGPGGLGLQ